MFFFFIDKVKEIFEFGSILILKEYPSIEYELYGIIINVKYFDSFLFVSSNIILFWIFSFNTKILSKLLSNKVE